MRLNRTERKRYDSGMLILKTLSTERSVISKVVKPSDATNVPNDVSKDIKKILKQVLNHEVFGSVVAKSKSMVSRKPNDIDVAVDKPHDKALKIADALKHKGYTVNINSMPQFNSHVVQIKKRGKWVDVVDLHPIKKHSKQTFDVYGESVSPELLDGVYVQTMNDQLFRKANSVMAYNPKTGMFGASPHRASKDIGDFITVSRLLIDSKELKAKAELARVKKARRNLKQWKTHAKNKGVNGSIGKDPIPDDMEKRFIQYAVDNPEINVDDIKFKTRRSFRKKAVKQDDVIGMFDVDIPYLTFGIGQKKEPKSVVKRERYDY